MNLGYYAEIIFANVIKIIEVYNSLDKFPLSLKVLLLFSLLEILKSGIWIALGCLVGIRSFLHGLKCPQNGPRLTL